MNQNKDNLFYVSKPKWQWNKVNSKLLTTFNGEPSTIDLQPTVAFQETDSEGHVHKLNLNLSIDVEKSLPFDSLVGWNWHKSSNLPPITLKLQMKDISTRHSYPLPHNLQVSIFAVKINSEDQEISKNVTIDDVGLKGISRLQVKEQYTIFDGIRFQTTSYINEGVKFNLLILLYIKDKDENQQISEQKNSQNNYFKNIITAVVSPPIFVDSRKSARDYFEKRYMSYADAFNPALMERQFMKKSTKDKQKQRQKQMFKNMEKQKEFLNENQNENSNENEIKIENSLQGLFNYLTAPNIRHKVKHPLLLCVKFSNVFKIMYNRQSQQTNSWEQNQGERSRRNKEVEEQELNAQNKQIQIIIQKLQKILLTQIGRQRKSKKSSAHANGNSQIDKPFIITLTGQCSSPKKTKIYECLQFLNCNSIQFAKHCHQLGSQFGKSSKSNYRNLLQIGDIVKAYMNIYDKLKQMSNIEINNRENEQKYKQEYANAKFRDAAKQKNSQKIKERSSCNIQKQQEIHKKEQQKLGYRISNKNLANQGINMANMKMNVEENELNNINISSISSLRNRLGLQSSSVPSLETNDLTNRLINILLNSNQSISSNISLNRSSMDMNRINNGSYYTSIIEQISYQNSVLQNILLQNYIMREKLAMDLLNNINSIHSNSLNPGNFSTNGHNYVQNQDKNGNGKAPISKNYIIHSEKRELPKQGSKDS